MKKFLFLGLNILFLILSITGCTKTTKRGEELISISVQPGDLKITETKLDRSNKQLDDWEIAKMGIENLENLEQLTERLNYEQLLSIEEINIFEKGKNMVSLKGIEKFKNLIYLSIQFSKIQTIRDIQFNNKLQYIFLGNSQIVDISEFASLGNLVSLGLYGCPINEIKNLSEIKNLRNLSLDSTNISGLDGSKLPHSLRYLGLRETKFKSLRAIESTFPFVEIIDLSHGAIESVEDVQDFGHVQQIGLVGTPVMEKFRDKDGKVPQSVDYKGVTLIFVEPDF